MIASQVKITSADLGLPDLPAELAGLRIAHLSDLHVSRRRRRHRQIIRHLGQIPADLIFLTGDYMTWRGDEDVSLEVLAELCRHFDSRLGVVGVFGNHDSIEFRDRARSLPIHWLCDQAWHPPGLPIEVLGVECSRLTAGDSIAMLDSLASINTASSPEASTPPPAPRPLRLLLSHYPMYLPTAADMGVDVMFSGHTHGGQFRLPHGRALYNSSDLPMHLTSGILRLRRTLAVVSRGLGETYLALRLFCPPHIPVYTLHRAPMPGLDPQHILNLHPW